MNSKAITQATSLFLVALFGLVPVLVSAAAPSLFPTGYWGDPPLVPCGPGSGGDACKSICQIAELIQRLVYFAATLGLFIAAPAMIAWGGITIILGTTSLKDLGGGKSAKVSEGKKIISSTIIGIVIVLGAFLIIQTFLWIIGATASLTGSSSELGWPNFTCSL